MSYNVTGKLIIGTEKDIAQRVADYINTIPSTKTIRSIAISDAGGTGRVVVLVVHDA